MFRVWWVEEEEDEEEEGDEKTRAGKDAAVEVVACWHRIVDSDELEEGMMSMKRRNWTKLSRCLE